MDPLVGAPPRVVHLYGRAGCHLCDEARAALQVVLEERAREGRPPLRLEERAITDDPAWERRFLTTIPVLEVGDEELPLATGARAIRRFLERVVDGRLA